MNNRRFDWVVVIASIAIALSGCGGGCGGCGMEPIPGGFPVAKRAPNAAQVRVTPTALTAISSDPAKVIGPLVGNAMNGVITFNVPGSCGGNPEICCVNGQPSATCGPLEIDLVKRPTDPPRLVLTPVQGASRLDMTIRARVKTKMKLPIKYDTGLFAINCDVNIDTTQGSTPDLRIDAQILFTQDPTVGTTRITAQNVAVTQVEGADLSLSGNIGCTIGGAFIGAFTGTLQNQIASTIQSTINDATCKACDSGNVADCGSSFATACTGKVCQVGNRCLQELGIDGRMPASGLFGGLSPGTTGALDLYEVTGSYATSDSNGLALGLLGGMEPGGVARDRCGPPATAPMMPTITPSAVFQANTLPGSATTFDIGIGVHKSQLAQFAYAGYDGGLLCLTIGGSTIAQLNTDTLSLLSRSLGDLVEGSSPMAVGLRPQSPPVITLGKNTFKDDGTGTMVLDQPLLDIKFTGMEIDFFASIDDQYVRVFTLVSDVHLPVGLQVMGMGKITPVIGSISDAFTNLSVKNSEAITESPDQLKALFPTLLNLVIPQLSGGLSPISLPAIGGLNLSVVSITSVDNDNYLGIFANLVTTMAAPVHAPKVTVADVIEAPKDIAKRPTRWTDKQAPKVLLDFGAGAGETNLEWSYRINGGTWSAWSQNAHPTLSSNVFWLTGTHKIEVLAREVGKPETIAVAPEVVEVVIGEDAHKQAALERNAPFHGQSGAAGCACDSSGAGAVAAAPFMLVILMMLMPFRRVLRRLRRRALRLGSIVWLAAVACLPGCSCSDAPCGSSACMDGELPNGGLGRFNSIAGDDKRVMAATYDTGLGDLVVVDVTDASKPKYTVVDGVPTDVTPTYDPSTYRGGIEDPGPDVGAWTSIAMASGHAMVAYQDREAHALKFAREKKAGSWSSYTLDMPDGSEEVGQHVSMTIDGSGHPAIAYLAIGIDDGMGHRETELRLLRAGSSDPKANEWSSATIATGAGTCAGLCEGGKACIAGAATTDPQVCTAITSDCASACGSGDVCIATKCVTPLAKPTVTQLATGTGLYVNLVTEPDGRLAAVYYDRNKRALMLSLEDGPGANTFKETTLDTVTPGDRGMWTSAVVDGAGTIHIAYQEALGDQLMYTNYAGSVATPELVDDGVRMGDYRTHPVGAGASIYLVNGTPTIAYQDGLTADVSVALTDLSYYGARYYDRTLLGWTQVDPVYLRIPDLGKLSTPRRSNLAAFSLNNPIRYLDPDGTDSVAPLMLGSGGSQCRQDASGGCSMEGDGASNYDGEKQWLVNNTAHDKSKRGQQRGANAAAAFNAQQASRRRAMRTIGGRSSVFQGAEEVIGETILPIIEETPVIGPEVGKIEEELSGIEAEADKVVDTIETKAGELFKLLPDDLFEWGQCHSCANAMSNVLEESGIVHNVLYMQANGGQQFIWSDILGKVITTDGTHSAVQVGAMIFDNLTRSGIDAITYMATLHAPNGISVITTGVP